MPNPRLQRLLQGAVAHLQAERLEEAERACMQARRVAVGETTVLHISGLVALKQGRVGEAAEWLGQVRRKQPRNASVLMCLGLALNGLGRRTEAEAALRDAAKIAPESEEVWLNLGVVCIDSNQLDQAIACFQRAVQLRPTYAQGWAGLGTALHRLGRIDEAIDAHTRALKIDPRHPKARLGRAQAYTARHSREEAIADLETHLRQDPGNEEARSNRLFLLNYRDTISAEALFAEHCAYGRELEKTLAGRPIRRPTNSPDSGRRLRVAFLSPDLRQHSVAYFLEPLLRHLDRREFEISLYHDHPTVDAVSERLRALATGWRNFAGQSDDVVESTIRGDAPDVLFDLAGHTGLNRLRLFARRLAPVQLSYLGYPNTTGVSAIYGRFTDGVADPLGEADALHTERLIRFAPTAWSYLPPSEAPAVSPLPCLQSGDRSITFGSFNALSKMTSATLELWGHVLQAVPDSRLVVKSHGSTSAAIHERMRGMGITSDRVVSLPATPDLASHLACYGQIDIALDTFPYHGTTTTCEALWMGVPVVTRVGDRHASRVGASLLTAIGHSEWVGGSTESFVAAAVALARDRTHLAELRATLREQLGRSALLDHVGQAARFGIAIRSAWTAWCAQTAAAA